MPIPVVFLNHTCNISSTINRVVQRLDLTDITGTFVVGEDVGGATSEETATIYAVGSTYLLLTALTGDFTSGETITGEGGAIGTATGTNYDAVDDFGVPIVVAANQTDVACVFFGGTGSLQLAASGDIAVEKPTVFFSPETVVYKGDQITGTSDGFTTTYTAEYVDWVYLFSKKYMKIVTLEAVD